MLDRPSIALIEPDDRRRAQISFACTQAGMLLDPYESVGELGAVSDKRAIVVHDSGEQLSSILELCAQAGRWLPIIAYSPDPLPTQVTEAIFAGALDYLAQPFSPADLKQSLERVRDRGESIGPRRANAAKARSKLEMLSCREHQVVTGMAEGLTNKAIARHLQISPRTVEIHRANAIGKLGVKNSSQAILLAVAADSDG